MKPSNIIVGQQGVEIERMTQTLSPHTVIKIKIITMEMPTFFNQNFANIRP